jgi:hypothetical protein
LEEEFGIIPMTNIKFLKRVDRVINLGTAGGQTKAAAVILFNYSKAFREVGRLLVEVWTS